MKMKSLINVFWLVVVCVRVLVPGVLLAEENARNNDATAKETRDKDGLTMTVSWVTTPTESAPEQLADVTSTRSASAKMPPDGVSTGTVVVQVVNGSGNPVPGVRVAFGVSYIYPDANYRTEDGMVQTYTSVGGNGNKARAKIRSGEIRLLGTLNQASAVTDVEGYARVEYRTSHIGSDLPQVRMAVERITSTLPNGSTSTIDVEIGYDDLVEVPSVSGGLRVVGATGKHVQQPLATLLSDLGNAVVQAQWPKPVTVTAASLHWGGQYPPHFTHKHGGTLDIRPMSTDGNATWAKQDGTHAANYDFERTKALISVLRSSGATVVYFNGKDAGGTPLDGHDNHIHVSWITERIFSVNPSNVKGALAIK